MPILPQFRARFAPASADDPDLLFSPPEKPKQRFAGKHHSRVACELAARRHRRLLLVTLCFLAAAGAAVHLTRPAGRGSSTAHLTAQPAAPEQHRLLLATHNRLAWYYPLQDRTIVLHEGQGVHYGLFPGDSVPGHPSTVWNLIRPHNWRPATETEWLVQFDADTGAELNRVQVPSRFSHDAVRVGDRVYVCSTGSGAILELSYPDMSLVRTLPLFSQKDHPNTLAAVAGEPDHLWVLLHNLGDSDLVKVYVGPESAPHEVSRISSVGSKAHGLVAWGPKDLLMLDSDYGALVSVDVTTGHVYDLYVVPEEGKFLKGLAVLDDVAYFGITTWAERRIRDSAENNGELGAFDLVTNTLLWRRTVPTAGLLNIIGAPHLAADSTYTATYSSSNTAEQMRQPLLLQQPAAAAAVDTLVMHGSRAVVQQAADVLTAAGFPPRPIEPADYWSSGWPRLNPESKLTRTPEDAGLQLPLFLANISALQSKVVALPDAAWSREYQAQHNAVLTGRTQNMDRFKPGVEGILLLFSDNEGATVYEFPMYRILKEELEPLLTEILGPTDVSNIVRLQLARMAPGTSDIKVHQDMGGYAIHGHRIHLPLVTHPLVAFEACPDGDGSAAAAAAAAAVFPQLQAGSVSSLSAAAADPAADPAAAAVHHTDRPGHLAGARGGAEMRAAAAAGELSAGQRRRLQGVGAGLPLKQLLQQPGQQQQQQQQQQQVPVPVPPEQAPIELMSGYYTGDAADAVVDAAAVMQGELSDAGAATASSRQPQQAPKPQQEQKRFAQPAPSHTGAARPQPQQHQHQHQQPQRQRQSERLKLQQHRLQQRPCTKLFTPEGLVFELNNRVPHKVSNPAASGTARVHLVIDVFETSRVRTPLLAGSSCEYGALPKQALAHLVDMLADLDLSAVTDTTDPTGSSMQLQAAEDEIRAMVSSPGMSCVGPDGRRVRPLRAANPSAVEAAVAQQEEAMVQQLLGQLRALAGVSTAAGAVDPAG